MGSVGLPELIVIFTIAMIVFGPRRLPELGRSLGRALSEFKRATNDLQQSFEQEVERERVGSEATASAQSENTDGKQVSSEKRPA